MSEITITKENFEKEVMQSDIPVLLDFWATWCGPCQRLAPIVAEIAEEYEGKLKVGKIDVDEQRDLAIDFRVSSIPYVVVIKDGKVVNTAMGYAPKESVVALLKDLIL